MKIECKEHDWVLIGNDRSTYRCRRCGEIPECLKLKYNQEDVNKILAEFAEKAKDHNHITNSTCNIDNCLNIKIDQLLKEYKEKLKGDKV